MKTLALALPLSLTLTLSACSNGKKDKEAPAADRSAAATPAASEPAPPATLMRGTSPAKKWATRPRPKPQKNEGLRPLPDGELVEWGRDSINWQASRESIPGAKGWSGPGDLSARFALSSYEGGLGLALEVTDDRSRQATYAGALPASDHVELELIPRGEGKQGQLGKRAVGLRLRVGTVRQLVEVLGEKGIPRKVKPTAQAVAAGTGYRLEMKIPLAALTPLPEPELRKLDYRVTLFDADADGEKAAATMRFAGQFRPDPVPRVPEAVRKRGSVRACMSVVDGALWGYWNGWRCAVPFIRPATAEEDGARAGSLGMAFHRVPEPPRIVWIRERVLFINMPGLNQGIAALINQRKVITSVMTLGVVSAEDPGNPLSRNSGAEPFELPDGTWALAVVHAYPRAPGPLGGRCGGTHRVYLSVLALRRAFKSTPHKPAPEPDPPPELEEILRVLLDDCRTRAANDWSLSKDRSTIRIKSSLRPHQPVVEYKFSGGRYIKKGD